MVKDYESLSRTVCKNETWHWTIICVRSQTNYYSTTPPWRIIITRNLDNDNVVDVELELCDEDIFPSDNDEATELALTGIHVDKINDEIVGEDDSYDSCDEEMM